MKHIMFDIETLGTKPGCVILSIGAIEFDLATGELGKSIELFIDSESSVAHGLTIEPRTVMWWMMQNEAARREITGRTTVPLDRAMIDFHQAFDWKEKKVWCNGANFDFPILAAAMDVLGLPEPWK